MKFDWNEAKNDTNVKKHGLSFDFAIKAFRDPLRIDMFDSEHSDAEDRYVTIGFINDVAILLVYTVSDDTIRIISARKALKREVDKYYFVRQ